MLNFTTTILLTIAAALLLMPLAASAADGEQRITFDQGHKQRFRIEDSGELQLSGLAAIIRSQGAAVASSSASISDETLSGISGLVISGPFESLEAAEVDTIVRFVEKGGHLAVMLHIGAPLSDLLKRLDVDYSNTVLHERSNTLDNDLNFRVTDLSADPLFEGISHFSAYGVWALNPGASSAGIARTSDKAWVDLNGDRELSDGDAVGAFSVVVSGTHGAGKFIVFGDDAIFQNRYLDESNRRLARNLGRWLLSR